MRLAALPLLLLTAPVSAEFVFDGALGASHAARSYSVGAAHRLSFFSLGYVKLGCGARATLATGRLELYPAKQDTGGDSLTIDAARLGMLNVNVHAALAPTKKTELGFNLDVAGVGFGSAASAVYRPHPTAAPVTVAAAPAAGNIFLWGNRDIGSLNSEFYVSYRVVPTVWVRAGLSHLLTEYKTERELAGGTRRFRRFSNLGFVGVRVSLL